MCHSVGILCFDRRPPLIEYNSSLIIQSWGRRRANYGKGRNDKKYRCCEKEPSIPNPIGVGHRAKILSVNRARFHFTPLLKCSSVSYSSSVISSVSLLVCRD